MFRRQENTSVKIVTFCSTLTCIYIPSIIFVLYYTNNIYRLGKYSSGYLLLALLLAELFKIGFAIAQPDASALKDAKHVKSKKVIKIRSRDVFKALIMLPCCVAIYFVLIILFGAPITTAHEETFMLSLLLTVLTVFPSCFQAGVDATVTLLTGLKWYSGDKMMEMLQQNIILTIFGTWCGGIVIPLDWDRPWQVWPIPCCLGAIIGYLFSHAITLIKLIPFIAKRIAKRNRF